MSAWALIVAAGAGTRMGHTGNKALMPLAGEAMLSRAVRAFSGEVDGVMIVTRAQDVAAVRALGLAARIVTGGDTRQRSVLCGLRALPEDAEIVLVHDAARPLVDRDTIRRCLHAARQYGSGVACVPVKDTIKQADAKGIVQATPARETLFAAQTPQAFRVPLLRGAIQALEARGETATDDAGAVERMGEAVRLVEGAYTNIKLTTPEDIAMAEQWLGGGEKQTRVGHGYDVHRLVADRPLILCGVEVPYEKGLLGHSDADVALHALMDALLGAAALGDIGRHFPDSDARFKGISSLALLEQVMSLLYESGYAVGNVDVTIVAERPKLKAHLGKMNARLARVLGVASDHVNVKATTTEGLGFEGEGLGISAHAVAVIYSSMN